MTHLSDAELVDAAERTLAAARRAHLDSCDRCRGAAAELESMLREVASVDVPEPSPLFWGHLSARVHEAVAAEKPAASGGDWASLRARWIQIAAFCAIVIAVASTAWFVRPRSVSEAQAAAVAARSSADSSAAADDPAWTELSDVAAAVNVDEDSSAAFTVRPAAVDTAVQRLTPSERAELRRLLQTEMKGSSD